MLEKWTDKAAKLFSKKTVEHTKQAIADDVKQNQTGYIMSAITGLVIAVGVVTVVKAIIGGVASSGNVNNYYIYVTDAEQIGSLIATRAKHTL